MLAKSSGNGLEEEEMTEEKNQLLCSLLQSSTVHREATFRLCMTVVAMLG